MNDAGHREILSVILNELSMTRGGECVEKLSEFLSVLAKAFG